MYIDDGPYWPSLEHLIAHFMRFSYGLPVSLKYPVPPQPKPEVPSFATIPRATHKQKEFTPTTPLSHHPGTSSSVTNAHPHVPALTITKKKQKENSSSIFNSLRLTSPKKGLFDVNSLRKSKSKSKRSDSESSASVVAAELQVAAPMLKNLSFSTDFSNFNVDAAEVYNVPQNNTPIELPPIANKTEAEVEYFTKSDVAINKERETALNANGYLPTMDVLMLLDQPVKPLSRLVSTISTGSTESEMAGYLQRKCSAGAAGGAAAATAVALSPAELEAAKQRFFIHRDQLELEIEIGAGEFGSVYKGWLQRPNAPERLEVAIKTLRDEEQQAINKQEFLREASVMMRLEHKCIVRLIGISKGDMLMMVQELAPLGSMLQYILDHSAELKVNYELKLWASQIACGKS